MAIVIASDTAGQELKDTIVQFLNEKNLDIQDLGVGEDFVQATLTVVDSVRKSDDHFGIVIDAYGVGPFMVATKIKGIIAAVVSDERSAYMTRSHNNSRIITLGSEILGDTLAKQIVQGFLEGEYDGGRHQIRVDMLNKLC